jgi:hypothetical protein
MRDSSVMELSRSPPRGGEPRGRQHRARSTYGHPIDDAIDVYPKGQPLLPLRRRQSVELARLTQAGEVGIDLPMP